MPDLLESIIKKAPKEKKITNKNVMFRNTLEHVQWIMKSKDINLSNLFENIYDISEKVIEFINKYNIKDTEKNKLITQILLNIIEDLISNITSMSEEDLKTVKQIKEFIQETLPFYIKAYVEADLNEEDIIEIQKSIMKLICSCIIRNT